VDLADKLDQCGMCVVQLALDPLRLGAWDVKETTQVLAQRGITIVSGMMAMAGEDYSSLHAIRMTGGVRPEHHWMDNLHVAGVNAKIAAALGLPLVTFHAGFLPHDRRDPEYATMIERISAMAEMFHGKGVSAVALETGQESAPILSQVMRDLANSRIGVNFDPANMILYDMGDPVAAMRDLRPWIMQLHVKDALPATEADQWGVEVPAGHGAVRWNDFFACLNESGLDVDLLIEREAGDARINDVRIAAALVRQHCPGIAGQGRG